MKSETDSLYSTNDLAMASYLSLFIPLWGIDKQNTQKVKFLFKRDESLDSLIENFWLKTPNVSAVAYFAQIKFIKSRLYEQK